MADKRESMVFYRSFYEAIKDLDHEQQGIIYNQIFSYGLDFVEEELAGVCGTIRKLIKPQIDAKIKKYRNGANGGRPTISQKKKHEKPKRNQSITEPKANDNVNDNVNDNENHIILSDLGRFVEAWNRNKELRTCRKVTTDIKTLRRAARKKRGKEEIAIGVKNYLADIASRDKSTSYANHRFSLYEFLKQKNGLAKFINK